MLWGNKGQWGPRRPPDGQCSEARAVSQGQVSWARGLSAEVISCNGGIEVQTGAYSRPTCAPGVELLEEIMFVKGIPDHRQTTVHQL